MHIHIGLQEWACKRSRVRAEAGLQAPTPRDLGMCCPCPCTHTCMCIMGGACPRVRPELGWLYRRSRARNARVSRCICRVGLPRRWDSIPEQSPPWQCAVGHVPRQTRRPHTQERADAIKDMAPVWHPYGTRIGPGGCARLSRSSPLPTASPSAAHTRASRSLAHPTPVTASGEGRAR